MSNGNALQLYGDIDSVREMTRRLVNAMPGSKKLTPEQAGTLAQISVAHGLDPFNGEAWFIPGSGVMVGIKGLRKCAKNQLKRTAGAKASYWGTHVRVVDPKQYGAGDRDLVYEFHLRDTENIDAWSAAVKNMTDIGLKIDQATVAAGPAPVTIGIGIYREGEATKMEKHQCARKRAEADAIKQRFDVDFLFSDDDFDVDDIQISEPLGASIIEAEEIIQDEDIGNLSVKEMLEKISVNYAAKSDASIEFRGFVAGILSSIFTNDSDRYAVTEYLTGVPSLKDVPAPMVYAIRDWLDIDEENKPSAEAARQARGVLRDALVSEGQMEMEV